MLLKKSLFYWVFGIVLLVGSILGGIYIYSNYFSPVTSIQINSQVKKVRILSTDKRAIAKYIDMLALSKNNVIQIPGIDGTKIIKNFNFIITNVPQVYNQIYWTDQEEPFSAVGYTVTDKHTLNTYIYVSPTAFTRLKPDKLEGFINTQLKIALFQLSLDFRQTNKTNRSSDKTFKDLLAKYEKLIQTSGLIHIELNDK